MSVSLLTLFREELRSNGRVLAGGLARSGPDWSELQRAAHSIRGAAHIVALDAIESLAAAMEESLAAAKEAGELAPEARAALAEAVELLAAAAGLGDSEVEEWQKERRSQLAALASRVRGHDDVPPGRRSAPAGGRGDARMLELFRQETEAHAATLAQGLLALEADPGHFELLDSLMRSAHSIKGAARVVGLDVCVELAHAMEDALVGAKRGQLQLESDEIDLFLRATDLLVDLAEATGERLEEWLATRGEEPGATRARDPSAALAAGLGFARRSSTGSPAAERWPARRSPARGRWSGSRASAWCASRSRTSTG